MVDVICHLEQPMWRQRQVQVFQWMTTLLNVVLSVLNRTNRPDKAYLKNNVVLQLIISFDCGMTAYIWWTCYAHTYKVHLKGLECKEKLDPGESFIRITLLPFDNCDIYNLKIQLTYILKDADVMHSMQC